jgi:serine protease Do
MIARLAVVALVSAVGLASASAETVQLKDRSSVSGKILAEKRDAVFVDLGYTVLSVPRDRIAKIIKDEEGEPAKESKAKPGKAAAPATATTPGASAKADGAELYRLSKGTVPEKSVRELVAQLGEAVVQVRTPGGLGSGFFLNEEGHLITNFHVIEGETQISIEVYHQHDGQLERKVYKQIRILAMNKFQDLALLKVEDEGASKFSWVPLGDSDLLAVGERVFAIGSPLGLERTVTEGIVSTKTRQFQGELYIQTTTQINPGNSGGPLFNLRGEVTGVTNMKVFGEGLGFAIPIENVRYFLKHRDAYAYDTDNPSNPYRYLAPPNKMSVPAAGAAK